MEIFAHKPLSLMTLDWRVAAPALVHELGQLCQHCTELGLSTHSCAGLGPCKRSQIFQLLTFNF